MCRPTLRIAVFMAPLAIWLSSSLSAADWITAPGEFTHDPHTGRRVTQFAPIGPFHYPSQGNFQRSLYRQSRSSIQVGGSADHRHVVEEYGGQVRPYGEWRFPFRPYSAPYPAWGPPPGYGFGGGFGGGFFPPGGPGAPFGQPGLDPNLPPRMLDRGLRDGNVRPWQDGRHPPYQGRQRTLIPVPVPVPVPNPAPAPMPR